MRYYVGIDPGKGGGIACVNHLGHPAELRRMPESERDILDALGDILSIPSLHTEEVGIRAMLERVSSSPKMGVVSAFTFGRGYGGLRMALTAMKIPFDEVSPAVWQKAMGCRSGGDKNVTKRRAQELFPDQKITHAVADALLLAEYCRRLEALRGVLFEARS